MAKPKRIYLKPSLKSSKVKIINFYARGSLRSTADAENLLLAGMIS